MKIKICPTCGKEFICGTRMYGHLRNSTQKYCSRDCQWHGHYKYSLKCNKLSITSAAYLAGLVDGEGSIFFYRRRESVAMRTTISLTQKYILEGVAEETGLGSIVAKKNTPPARIGYTWQVNADSAANFLKEILPYLRLKKEQAKIAIAFQKKLQNPALKTDKSWQYKI